MNINDLYQALTCVFFFSILLCYLVVKCAPHYKVLINQEDLQGVQKVHTEVTPRIGGVLVFISFSIGLLLFQDQSDTKLVIWMSVLPVLFCGLMEDLSAQISPMVRLLSAFLSIVIASICLGIGITSLGFEWADYFLSNYAIVSLLFTLLLVGGAVNSLNIIDGCNGLLAGYSILALLAIAFTANILGDETIFQLCLLLTASIVGFFMLNFPFGKIFMGDGGAYFIGFMISIIGLMLVSRHDELSNWFVLLIFIYPMFEVLFSMFRRRFFGKCNVFQPDALHLHSLVYRKLILSKTFKDKKTICNNMVSPFMWVLSLVGIIPAVIWHDNKIMLIIWALVFMAMYTMIYKYITHAVSPGWNDSIQNGRKICQPEVRK